MLTIPQSKTRRPDHLCQISQNDLPQLKPCSVGCGRLKSLEIFWTFFPINIRFVKQYCITDVKWQLPDRENTNYFHHVIVELRDIVIIELRDIVWVYCKCPDVAFAVRT